MARASSTGCTGLFWSEDRGGHYQIDLRHTTAEGVTLRHRERLPKDTRAAAAKARAKALLHAMTAGTYVSPVAAAARARVAADGLLGVALERYLEEGIRPDQRAHRAAHVARIVDVLGAKKPLASLVPLDVMRVRAAMIKDGLSEATCNRMRATLLHAVGWARRCRLVSADVERDLRDGVKATAEQARDRVVHAEEEPVLATVGGFLRPFVLLARGTGCRLGELAAMTWRWVEITPSAVVLHLPRKNTKSGKPRSVPLPADLAAEVRALPRPADLDAYVLPVPGRAGKDERKRRVHAVSKGFAAWAASAGLADLHFHDLRHDAATRMVETSGNVLAVQAILGHSDLTMTRRYVSRVPQMVRDVMAGATVPGMAGGFAHPLPTGPKPTLRVVGGRR